MRSGRLALLDLWAGRLFQLNEGDPGEQGMTVRSVVLSDPALGGACLPGAHSHAESSERCRQRRLILGRSRD